MRETESSGPQEILAVVFFCIVCIPMAMILLLAYGNGELPTGRHFFANLAKDMRKKDGQENLS